MANFKYIPKDLQQFVILCICWWIFAGTIHFIMPAESISKYINGWHSPFMDSVMQVITMGGEAIVMIPLLALGVVLLKGHHFNWKLCLVIILAISLSSIITNLLKSHYNAPRPLTAFEGHNWIYMIPGYENHFWRSFPSGHTTGAFAMFACLSYLSRNKGIGLAAVFFASAVSVAISRIYLLQHFWEDILAGSLIGTLSALFILYFYEKYMSRHDVKS